MAVASGRLAAPAAFAPSSRWRSRPAQVGGIIGALADRLLRAQGPVRLALVADLEAASGQARQRPELAARAAHRGQPEPGLRRARGLPLDVRVARHGVHTTCFEWLTWVGTIAASVLLVWRFGGWRAGADRVRRVRLVRADGAVGGEHPDARADAGRGAALAGDRHPVRRAGRPPRGLLPRDHAGARRDADRPRVRVPDADRDPVLGRPGRGGDLHDDLRDPAGRAHHRARDPRRDQGLGRGGPGVRLDPVADAPQGAAAAGAPSAAAVGQPDDHVRALAGRDRRPDRRPGARRRRDQRALLERGAGRARGHRDRDHGDRPRPRDRGDRGAHRPHAPASDRPRPRSRAPADDRHVRGDRRDRAGGAGARSPVALPRPVRDRDHGLQRHDRRHLDALDPERARLHPGSRLVRLRDHRARRQLHAHQVPRAAARVPGRHAVVHRAGRRCRRSRTW